MIVQILTFLGSATFGSVLGLIQSMIALKQEHKAQKQRQYNEAKAIEWEQAKEFSKQIAEPFRWPSFRGLNIAAIVLLFSITYCFTIIWFLLGGTEPVYTYAFQPDTFDISLLFDTVSYSESETKICSLSSTGVAIYLMSLPNAIISNYCTGQIMRSIRK